MDQSQEYVVMPDSPFPVLLPGGWTIVNEGDPLTVMGPELDLKLSFIARPVVDDITDLLRRVWHEGNKYVQQIRAYLQLQRSS